MTPVQKTARDALVKEAKRIVVALEEMVDDLNSFHEEDAEFVTAFDHRRTTIDLRTAAHLVEGVERKLAQIGTWNETLKKSP